MRLLEPSLARALLAFLLILTGCAGARVMMPTPNVHLDPERDFYSDLDPALKSTEVSLFYLTDRAPERDEEGKLRYGYERSASVAFGSAVVDLGVNISWEELLEAHPDAVEDPDVKDSVSNLRSVFAVLDTRARELLDRVQAPERWTDHDIERLTANFTNLLAAIEKNSKGRYRIVYNIAGQERQDYMVSFGIESVDGSSINMPPVLQDVMRDLIANARKYTEPGGEITAGLVDNGRELRLVVEDSGRGIPPDEIQQVVEFGRRGSNVDDKETMGGGFGLTKAYLATRQFGGSMRIASRPGAGTRITISIPRPTS